MTEIHMARAAARRRYAMIAIWTPLAVFAALLIAQFSLLRLIPDPAAVHWELAGRPDGFAARWTVPFVTVVPAIVVTLLVAGAPYVADAKPAMVRGGAMRYRLMAALAWAETGFVATLAAATFLVQLGTDDARDATLPGWWFLVALGIAVVLALVAYQLTTEPPRPRRDPEAPGALPLAPTEQAVWIHTVRMSRAGVAVLGVLVAVLAAVVIGLAATQLSMAGGLTGGTVLALAILVLVVVLIASNAVFRVRVDADGLDVRSSIGWPRIRIPGDEIASAMVVHVNPMGEYGGWGWRYGAGGSGWGVVLRAGEAIRIIRRDGRPFTVTVDDAATGASLLNALAARHPHREDQS